MSFKIKYDLVILRILAFITICLILLTGCSRGNQIYTYPNFDLLISSISPPQDVKMFADRNMLSNEDSTTYIIRKLASVLAINKDGEILSLLYDENFSKKSNFAFRVYPAIYILDSASILRETMKGFSASKVIEAERGYKIINADFNKKWVVWVEADTDKWKIYKFNRNTKEIKLLDEGQILNLANDDFPVISLYENQAVVNKNGKLDSQILLFNFTNNTVKTLQKNDVKEKYYGPPKLDKANMVWHVRDLSNGNSKIFLYDMTTEKISEIGSEQLNSEYPTIWGNYVAWMSRTSHQHEIQLSVYDLKTEKIEFNTILNIENKSLYYRPSIANGKIAWYDLYSSYPIDCDIKYYKFETQEINMFRVADVLDGIFLPNNLEIHDSWISYNHPPDMVPNPEHPTRIVGTLFWRINK
ncbi:hypothetical protein [Paradesulfitobacterium ferrireducens]|uniref:hypothetical protein n=1 Tax=Paradesulfitobacterium ferrireducens TaxID=2816476 RepID=UPI001A8D46AE|nr:hypothetical protein [Paradesulfitobacterium ferrireducens]